ncbi:hypothetical protein OH77DRAFT_1293486 [Trametes cingulata]|nr:hypothetical protein OH77DRAFT_1293486 [Trametes cingulata]
MRAIRYHGPEDVRLDNIPEPIVGPKQVKIKGNTLPGLTPSAAEPHPITGDALPVVIGHEFSGKIVEMGHEVDTLRFAIGQNVAVLLSLPAAGYVEPLHEMLGSGDVERGEWRPG